MTPKSGKYNSLAVLTTTPSLSLAGRIIQQRFAQQVFTPKSFSESDHRDEKLYLLSLSTYHAHVISDFQDLLNRQCEDHSWSREDL
jgi:hypothetical protein